MRKILLFIILSTTAFYINAQEADKPIRIGVTGGLNSTWLFNENISEAGEEIDYFSTFGGSAGIRLLYSFSPKSGLSLEVAYSGHNQILTGSFTNFSYESKTRLKYLDFPLLFRLQSSKGPYFEFGPQVSFLLSAREDFVSDPADPDFDYKYIDFKNNFKGTLIGGVLGFGIDFDVNEKIIFSAGLRFGYGFTDMINEYSKTEMNNLLHNNKISYLAYVSHLEINNDIIYKPANRAYGGFLMGVTFQL